MRLRDCEFYVELANPPVSAKNAKTPPFTQGGLLTGLVIFLTEPPLSSRNAPSFPPLLTRGAKVIVFYPSTTTVILSVWKGAHGVPPTVGCL